MACAREVSMAEPTIARTARSVHLGFLSVVILVARLGVGTMEEGGA